MKASNFFPNRYYGYFDYEKILENQLPVFHVVLLKPANSRISDWIGSKDIKISNMLCIDDWILSNCNFPVDWSAISEKS